MLIIFDLDDTLIDTSGSITHYKLEDALHKMIEAGLILPDFSEGLELLRRMNACSESAKVALQEFIAILGADSAILEVGIKEIYINFSDHLSVPPLKGAVELLLDLSQRHQLALVTVGSEATQMKKLEKAGIDSRLFSKIAIIEEGSKKPHYQTIANDLGYMSEEVIVCGDRVNRDLIPARELGFKTVQMRWGRGLNFPLKNQDIVDYPIFELSALKEIINDLTRENL